MTFTPRVIPCLLVQGTALVKTVRFTEPTYVGDPANVLSIFSQLEVDEIALLDIRATTEGTGPNLGLLRRLADECIVPLTYGGGITSVDQAGTILEIGFEKVVLNSALADRPSLVTEAAEVFGRQAVVASVDARQVDGRYEVVTRAGTEPQGVDPVEYARRVEDLGAGEILLTSIDRDGTMEGYDLDLIKSVAGAVGVPVIACGGAGKRSHLADPIRIGGATAVAAGSLFVYQGRTRGVLINFPPRQQLVQLFAFMNEPGVLQ